MSLTQQSMRPLNVKQGNTEVSFMLNTEDWSNAELIREKFYFANHNADIEISPIELASKFLKQCIATYHLQPSQQFLLVTLSIFRGFRRQFLKDNDVHAVVRNLSNEIKYDIIETYFTIYHELKQANLFSQNDKIVFQPALLKAVEDGSVGLLGIFGGQGNTEDYFDETIQLYQTYKAFLSDYVRMMSDVLESHVRSTEASVIHSKGFNVKKWLEEPNTRPDIAYLISAPVSVPLIALTQLMQYYVLCHIFDKTPGEVRRYFKGVTGHSQGIVSATIISCSDSFQSFYKNSEKALGLLFWIGTRAHQAYPPTTINPATLDDSLSNNEGNPSPMLLISNLPLATVQKYVESTNSHLPEDRHIILSLINGPRTVVCSGPPQSLYGLNLSLRKLKAPQGVDQSRIPFSQRKLKFTSRFLPITSPFHSSYLRDVPSLIQQDIEKLHLNLNSKSCYLPIYSTDSGSDLRSSKNLSLELANQICTLPLNWEKATPIKSITHIIDFGPGGVSGIGALTHRNKEGRGIQIIIAGAMDGGNVNLCYRPDIFDTQPEAVQFSSNWEKDFCPKLVRTKYDNKVHIDTPMSRLLGKPPLMVAGMTPCTVNDQLVSAVLNAGYHIELAGGGHYNEKSLRNKVQKIMDSIHPGLGITLNILFLNVRQWGFQFPLVQVMRKEGLPMEGVCVAAGVPSLDVANDIMQQLKESGIRHVAFKPGSTATIRQVVQIASHNPDVPIIMQWTGGRAGGHHSFEDFHHPILETYSSIRSQKNIILVAGSGFGGADDTLPYLLGTWSSEFDYPPMPFDGLLFGSRMMVAKEALTSDAAKQAICDAPGVDDHEWEKTYKGEAGGVITVKSELGEPIHKLATRGVKLWKEFDDTIFNLPKDKRLKALLSKKEYVIKRLNADFQKVWFGKKADGSIADLPEMTYSEVAYRLVELTYIKHQSRWIDNSLRNLAVDFLRRVEERFIQNVSPSFIQSYADLNDPYDFIDQFFQRYPSSCQQLMATEDILYFLNICQRRGQKPVPFIPVLDEKFEVWFKKDSLWQSEDLDAVVDQDVQRTCILQGPAAAKHSRMANEPVKEILDGIYQHHIQKLKQLFYNDDESSIPVVEYLGAMSARRTQNIPGVAVVTHDGVVEIISSKNASELPSNDDWFKLITSGTFSWFSSLITCSFIVQNKKFIDNPISRLFRVRPSQRIVITIDQDSIAKDIEVYDTRNGKYYQALKLTMRHNSIHFILNEVRRNDVIALHLYFEFHPNKPYAPIHEIMENRNFRVKQFYYKLWFDENLDEDSFSTTKEFRCYNEKVSKNAISQFCQAVGNQAELYMDRGNGTIQAPVDFAIVVSWKAIIKALFPKFIDGDLLKLVHLSNSFRVIEGSQLLRSDDIVDTTAKISSVINTDSGKIVEVVGTILKENNPILQVNSKFLYRGNFTDFENTYQYSNEVPVRLDLKSSKDVALLLSKDWFLKDSKYDLKPDCSLIFRLESYYEFKDKSLYSKVKTTGTVTTEIATKEIVQVGQVDYEADDSFGNPVLEFLKRHGESIEQAYLFDNDGYTVMPQKEEFSSTVLAPTSNHSYAVISGDYNPIHVNPYFADLAGLPGTITHGMWTSASTRKFVEIFAADNHPQRVTAYDVQFLNMVLPSDRLETKLHHIGMMNGKKLLKVETFNQNGVKVLDGKAEVDQAITTYVFTGQGSQEPGMGMPLYNSSSVARKIWDSADRHFLDNYGFSILEIVRDNPKEKTIYFGGSKGSSIRKNYMGMTYDMVQDDGKIQTLPLFPEISETTFSHTFKAPNGLLYATQFTQPALTLMERAAFEDMRTKGLIQQGSPFAGHSLGEYAALAAIGDVLPIESLVDVVFYRGMTMQVAVPRDHLNRSNYGMCAVNPLRISKTFNETALQYVVDAIAHQSSGLLEIVNYNVDNWQYVVSGELSNLDTLTSVLNYLKESNVDLQKLMKTIPLEKVKEQLSEIIANALDIANKKKQKHGHISLKRGHATIPLHGIDVPFHSSFLLSGVAPFRAYLAKKITPSYINVHLLSGKYIPNLTAVPFEISKDYFEMVYEKTRSPKIIKVLRSWDEYELTNARHLQTLGYILLVELLAYQFASPVRWIETQDRLFTGYGVERLIEIGPSPTLCGMAERTLKLKYEAHDDAKTYQRVNLCYSRNEKEIYYIHENEVESAHTSNKEAQSETPKEVPVVAVNPVSARPSSAPLTPSFSDEPLKAVEVIHTIVAQKLKRSLEEIPRSKSVKDLSGGKSTLQNEILGDLQKEFGNNVPEKSEEMSLEELGSHVENGFSGTFGKHTASLVAKLISSKMPGGFSLKSARDHLSNAFGLGSGRVDGVLLHSLTHEPSSRLSSDVEAKNWLDDIAQSYANSAGISLNSASSSSSGSAATFIDSAELVAIQEKQNKFARQQLEVIARYLGLDLREGFRNFELQKNHNSDLQKQLDLWLAEHGEFYANGINPIFSSLKARRFDSYWNWSRQDALCLYYDIIFGRLKAVDRDVTAQCIHVMNRANTALMRYMQYYIDMCPEVKGENYGLAKQLGQILIENCGKVLHDDPVFKDVHYPTGPEVKISEKGEITYSETPRASERKLEHYVKTMCTGGKISEFSNRQQVQQNLSKIYRLLKSQSKMKHSNKLTLKSLYEDVVRSLSMSSSLLPDKQVRNRRSISRLDTSQRAHRETIPFLHLKKKTFSGWEYSSKLTTSYLEVLENAAKDGITFAGRSVLITGCGKDSIGVEILKGLLSGGAKVIVTTSRFSKETVEYYQMIYQRHGSRNSSLIVVPFNQGSLQDINSLVDYIYSNNEKTGLGLDLDYVIPFAAISEVGREISDIDSKSEFAHRIMLTNLLRLLGAIKSKKFELGYHTRPAQVILPLSPNHGTFGGDGLYGESKIGLETLFNRWYSESWNNYLTIVGAVIGWTRGTGLMSGNNIIAEGIEKLGVRTFSTQEMAFNVLGLMHPTIVNLSQTEPLWADLNGGLQYLPNLKQLSHSLRQEIMETSEIRRAISIDNSLDFKVVRGPDADKYHQKVMSTPKANMKFDFPQLKSWSELKKHNKLQGMLDLERVVVVTGFGEIGPWGNSRTRWEMEAFGEFSLEGCIEMAWLMGYIKHFNGVLKNGNPYSGWVDVKTNEPVHDLEIKSKYEESILKHSGIRLVEPELFEGYDPKKKPMLREVVLEKDLDPFQASAEEAAQFKLRLGDFVDIYEDSESGEWSIQIRKGATIWIPKALRFDRLVAGQIPTGWDPTRYGVPKDIIDQVDMITLFVLVSTVEALVSSGITDPYEFYKYVHVTEVGNTAGSGVGGMRSLAKMYKDRMMDKPIQKDILQETFINTMAAWVNLLLLSSSGPIKTPVGACATAVESVEIGVETILSGKAKVVIVGGYDDFQEEGSFEFANMKATSNAEDEFSKGRTPREMSRPSTTTRSGFMESHGAGIEILMTAKLAIEMGAPIYGIVALTNTATDKEGRSVPAPGQGILTTARELPSKFPLPILDISYRRRQLNIRRKQIKEWVENEFNYLQEELCTLKETDTEFNEEEYFKERAEHIQRQALRQEKEALVTWGNDFYKQDPRIAPIRGALASFGLTIDDIGVASFHGTSTKLNDKNESEVLDKQMGHLGRSKGNACPSIFQKWLTGHPKGAAAAWMLNGVLQVLQTGIIPGNRNADNIDSNLQQYEYVLYPSRSIHTDGIKAGLLKSFGFGQVGGEILVIHPDYLFGALEENEYSIYVQKNKERQARAYRYLHDSLTGVSTLVQVKEEPPYSAEQETDVYLNPTIRATFDNSTKSYSFKKPSSEASSSDPAITQEILHSMTNQIHNGQQGVGVDVELISSINISNGDFIQRNFTSTEISYCLSQPQPQASFAGKWSAKEAIVKALCSYSEDTQNITRGSGAPLNEIEIIPAPSGAPTARLHGHAKKIFNSTKMKTIKLSISHSGVYSVAVAIIQ